MNRFFLFSLLIVVLSSCKSNNAVVNLCDAEIISIDIENSIKEEECFSELIDSIKFITLQDDGIKYISRLFIKDSCYYVEDGGNFRVIVFDKEGEVKYSISKRGKAQDEYLEITDIAIAEDAILIFDSQSSKIIWYDKADGKYIETYNIPEGVEISNGSVIENIAIAYNSYGFKNRSNKTVTLLDGDKIVGSFIDAYEFIDERVNITQKFPFSHYNNSAYLIPLFSNIVYSVKPDTIVATYQLDFGKANLPSEFLQNTAEDDLLVSILRSEYVNTIENFMETEKYLQFDFCYLKNFYTAYYNKISKKTEIYNKSSFKSVDKFWAATQTLANTNNSVAGTISLSRIYDELYSFKSETESEISKMLIDIAEKANDKYEFIIVEYKFK